MTPLDGIIIERDKSGDSTTYCGNNCITLFGYRVKLHLSNNILTCPVCATQTEVIVTSSGYVGKFAVKNEADSKNVIIVSKHMERLPNSLLSRDFDEEQELRQLRAKYRK